MALQLSITTRPETETNAFSARATSFLLKDRHMHIDGMEEIRQQVYMDLFLKVMYD